MAIRKGLRSYNNQRLRFTAMVGKFGLKSNFRGADSTTILLNDIKIAGEEKILTDHVWFTVGMALARCTIGDTIEFDARVTSYEKGYKGYRVDVCDKPIQIDYRLERPTKVAIIQGVESE